MRATIHARTEHLRRLRIPEHAAIGGSHDATVFDHFERVNRRRGDNRAIGVERTLQRVDGMRDELRGDERTGAIVQHHVLIFFRRVFQARKRAFLARGTRRSHRDRRHKRIRVNGATAIFGNAFFGTHHHDFAHIFNRIERRNRPGEHGASRDLNELLAALVAEALARAARQNNGSRFRALRHLARKMHRPRARFAQIKTGRRIFGDFNKRRRHKHRVNNAELGRTSHGSHILRCAHGLPFHGFNNKGAPTDAPRMASPRRQRLMVR